MYYVYDKMGRFVVSVQGYERLREWLGSYTGDRTKLIISYRG